MEDADQGRRWGIERGMDKCSPLARPLNGGRETRNLGSPNALYAGKKGIRRHLEWGKESTVYVLF